MADLPPLTAYHQTPLGGRQMPCNFLGSRHSATDRVLDASQECRRIRMSPGTWDGGSGGRAVFRRGSAPALPDCGRSPACTFTERNGDRGGAAERDFGSPARTTG